MTRHWQRKAGALLAALLILVVPTPALAWDSPLTPVSPATDNTALHGLGLIPAGGPSLSSAAANDIVAGAVDLPASVDLTPWAMPVGTESGAR